MPSKTKAPALPVTRVEGSHFQVGSETEPGKVYSVGLADSGYRCSCEAGQHGRYCKHVKAALAKNEADQVQLGMEMNGGLPKKANASQPRSSRLDKLGYEFDEVTSAMQKEIRRGDEEAAVFWGLLLYDASPFYAWKRVLVTAAEDIGLASERTVGLVCSLGQAWRQCKEGSYFVSPHHLVMALILLCRSSKSTEVEDLLTLTEELQKRGEKREMPAYAIDGHTKAGRERGAQWDEWYADRVKFGMRPNRYTERLWQLVPEWRPKDGA